MAEEQTSSAPAPPSLARTVIFALVLCLACALAIAGVAVSLRDLQVSNRENDRKKVILQVAGLYEEGRSIDELFQQVQPRVVDLETGAYVDAPGYDQRSAAKDPEASVAIPSDQDIAKIRRRAKRASVYLVEEDGRVQRIVLPVHGYGLWSTMYAFVALEADANTIYGLQFYEQAETAGLGARVTDPEWVAQFRGKRVYDEQGEARVEVVKGLVDAGSPMAGYQVDGLSGATLTADGVTYLLRYWLGAQGFETYLGKVRS